MAVTEHAAAAVDILDESLAIAGSKPRGEVDKNSDRYHTVFVQVTIEPQGHLVLSRIPHREDLPNTWAGRYGLTAGTIRRSGETALAAARRVITAELGDAAGEPEELGTYPVVDGSVDRLHTLYRLGVPSVPDYSTTDIGGITVLAPAAVDQLVADPEAVSPSLAQAWGRFSALLP